MHIETVPNCNSTPTILLRETYRDGAAVRKRTLLNLTHWPVEKREGLRALLKGGVVLPPEQDALTIGGVVHSRIHRLMPMPYRLCRLSGQNGVHSRRAVA